MKKKSAKKSAKDKIFQMEVKEYKTKDPKKLVKAEKAEHVKKKKSKGK